MRSKKCWTVLLSSLLLTGCAYRSKPVLVGDTVFQRVSFGSIFGPYQAIVLSYPVGQTNLQQIIVTDSNSGPGGAALGSVIAAAGFVWGMSAIRPSENVNNNSNTTSSEGGSPVINGGAGSTSTTINNNNSNMSSPTISGGNQDVTVQAPGSR